MHSNAVSEDCGQNNAAVPSADSSPIPERIQVYVILAGAATPSAQRAALSRLTSNFGRAVMQPLVMLGIVMVVLWAVLWLGLKIATGMIHVMLIVGLAFVIWGLIKKGARAIT